MAFAESRRKSTPVIDVILIILKKIHLFRSFLRRRLWNRWTSIDRKTKCDPIDNHESIDNPESIDNVGNPKSFPIESVSIGPRFFFRSIHVDEIDTGFLVLCHVDRIHTFLHKRLKIDLRVKINLHPSYAMHPIPQQALCMLVERIIFDHNSKKKFEDSGFIKRFLPTDRRKITGIIILPAKTH